MNFARGVRLVATAVTLGAMAAMPAVSQDNGEKVTFTEDDLSNFAQWVSALRSDAREAGVSEATLDAALADLSPNSRVLELDRRQPEFTQTFDQYRQARLSETRIARGREMMAAHADTLEAVGKAYNVQPRFIVAIWGLETNYGAYTGGMSVIQSLATLAWDPRRSAYFRGELINALKIIDAGHISADEMLGSWAGAMGQGQFMPSSFLDFAQDFDGDNRRNIWTSEADVFASIANYLSRYGWNAEYTWGRQVQLPDDWASNGAEKVVLEDEPKGCRRALRTHSRQLELDRWNQLGVRRLNGDRLPDVSGLPASLVQPGDESTAAFLTYPNYRAILRYNCSNFYGLVVGLLADAVD